MVSTEASVFLGNMNCNRHLSSCCLSFQPNNEMMKVKATLSAEQCLVFLPLFRLHWPLKQTGTSILIGELKVLVYFAMFGFPFLIYISKLIPP